jgi:hypothetical protein
MGVTSLYDTFSVFSIVGFGDIMPTATAQIVLSTSMLLDLVIMGAVVRSLLHYGDGAGPHPPRHGQV